MPPISTFRKSRFSPHKLGPLVGTTLAVLAGLILRFLHFGTGVPLGASVIYWSYDLPFLFRPNLKPDGAVIVKIDDDSHEQLHQIHGSPWDRSYHAKLIDRLKTEGAKVIVLDIEFNEQPAQTQATAQLAQAIRAHGNVLIGAKYETVGQEGIASGWRVLHPVESLENAAAGIGLVNFYRDPDFGVREFFPGAFEGTAFVPSIAAKAAQLAGAPIPTDPNELSRERWLNYYGPAARTIPSLSYYQALEPRFTPPGFFKNQTVFVGQALTSTGFTGAAKDEFRNPYTWWTKTFSSGVEIHTTAFLNLIHRSALHRLPPTAEFLLLLTAGTLAGLGLTSLRPLTALLVAACSIIAITILVVFLLWPLQLWFAWLIIVAVQIPLALAWSITHNSVKLYVQQQLLQQSLAYHLSPARVKQILHRPDLLKPGAVQQEISILFTDIANFSKITGRMEPEDLFKLLNSYFETALACVHATDGTVVKLIGDAIFAIWNAPFVQPDQQERACRAALKLREQLVQFDASGQHLPLRTRVGLHTGPASVGNVGSSTRFDYTAIGDNINLASRLEGLNKFLGTDILATRDIQKIVEPTVLSRLAGHFKFKGIDRIVEVHELLQPKSTSQPPPDWLPHFAKALFHFQRRAFKEATAEFQCVLNLHNDDGPSLFYLERLQEFQTAPPPDDWTGEIDIKEK